MKKLTNTHKAKIQQLIFNEDYVIDQVAAELKLDENLVAEYCEKLITTLSDIIEVKIRQEQKKQPGESEKLFGKVMKDGKSRGVVVMTRAASERGDAALNKSRPSKPSGHLYSPKTGKPV